MRKFATLGLACLLAAPSFAQTKDQAPANVGAAPPTTAVPKAKNEKWWMDRHEAFLARTKQRGVDLAFVGDSITQGWEGDGKAAWKENFAPLKAANYGIGGDQTQHVLWRLTEGKEFVGIAPKVVVLMIGTNNFGSHTPVQIAAGVEAIVKEVRQQERGVEVLLLGIFPRAGNAPKGDSCPAANLNPKVAATNALLAKFDDGKHVHYLDIGKKFLEKDGSLSKKVMPDYLHLSADGYERWAKAILPKVKELLK